MLIISSQRSRLASSLAGTNGCGSIYRSRAGWLSERSDVSEFLATGSVSMPLHSASAQSANVVMWSLSRSRASMSASAIEVLSVGFQRSLAFNIVPFSAIIALPSNVRSVDDSPHPAPAYTYAHRQRADCCRKSDWRYAYLPIRSSDADRLRITCAPAIARCDDGGIGTHRSSQISMPTFAPCELNMRPVDISNCSPRMSTVSVFPKGRGRHHLRS